MRRTARALAALIEWIGEICGDITYATVRWLRRKGEK